MTDDTEIDWHKEQIAKNRAVLEELEAGNNAGGNVFPETMNAAGCACPFAGVPSSIKFVARLPPEVKLQLTLKG